MLKVCSGFGHRNVLQNIDEKLYEYIEEAIKMGCTVFYTGAMGDFDTKFSLAVRQAKHRHKNINIKLICVKPYLTKSLNIEKEFYYSMYDDILIPTELANIHYKSIITKRNEWIIDNSDVVISYTIHNYGGAFTAVKYAEKNNKIILKI